MRSRLVLFFIAIGLAAACAATNTTPKPAAPSAPPADTAVDVHPVADVVPNVAPSAAPTAAEELAVGEAVLIDGEPIVRSGNPTGNALDYRSPWRGRLVVSAQRPGDAVLEYTASGAKTERRFRVVAELCRDRPLHPALILGIDERATLQVGETRSLEAMMRQPWIAAVHAAEISGQIHVVGQAVGRSTIMHVTPQGEVRLWDVFVGGACKDKAYVAAAPAVPPGFVGPKGDGTCVRIHNGPQPAPCPDRSKLDAMSNEALSPLACDWAASCGRIGHEGCCVACANPMRMHLSRACALRIVRSNSCPAVQKLIDAPTCGTR